MQRALILAVLFLALTATGVVSGSDPYRVVWDSPSSGWNETTPIGNGETCANVYFNGDVGRLHLLVARTDSWDELGRLAKLAEVCVEGFPQWDKEKSYRQTLDTERGLLTIEYDGKGTRVVIEVWVDVERDVVVVESKSDEAIAPFAYFYVWRDENAGAIQNAEVGDLFWGSKTPAQIRPDRLATEEEVQGSDRIAIYHRNEPTPYYDETAKTQGSDDLLERANPLENRTFGCVVKTRGGVRASDSRLSAPEGKTQLFEIAAVTTENAKETREWFADALATLDSSASETLTERATKRDEFWREIANRSWLRFSANLEGVEDEKERASLERETELVSRGYALQRYITTCQGYGRYPIKFNGGLFTTAPLEGGAGRHDYRRWGAGYWFQNTRLSYYPAFASGDLDQTDAFFDMYAGLLPLFEARVQKYFGGRVQGSYYPECIFFWGDVFPETYGLTPWNEHKEGPLQESRWHRWEWVGGLEIAFMALQRYEYDGDEKFLREKALPIAFSLLRFFDTFYEKDPATGKMKATPSQALETWWECVNAAPEIAGIRAVVEHILALPQGLISDEERAFCERALAWAPELPERVDKETGKAYLAPAERFASNHNLETPELYSLFPFRLVAFESPNADKARLAMEKRLNKFHSGWGQDDVFYAYLGDRENARSYLAQRAAESDPKMRFPAFWGPNFDWTPDQDHGGILRVAATSLALQSSGRTIYVNPACPKEWNAEFKLRAPYATTVEGRVENGKVVELKVEPAERAKDVVIMSAE